jgi:hypothetical protein
VIVDNIYHHLVFHLAIFRKVQLSIGNILGEPFIYYNVILFIIFGTVVLLVLFSRALVGVAKNIGTAMFKFKSADSQLLNGWLISNHGISSITSSLSVLNHSWDRAHARSDTEVMTSFSRSVCTSSGIDYTRLRKQPAWD